MVLSGLARRAFRIVLAVVTAVGACLAQGQQTSRPMFLTGNVVLSDGATLPEPVPIEMECQGQEQPQGRTDASGEFGFQIGMNRNTTPNDASQRSPSTSDNFGGPIANRQQVLGAAEYSLFGCGIRAVLDGYSSSVIELSGRRAADSAEIGTIILTRLGADLPATVSVTSLQAPENAKRAYERALQQIGNERFDAAERQLTRAVEIYPEYADAWLQLGVAQGAQDKSGEARKSYEQAIAVDSEFVAPYLHLSLMAAREANWPDAARYSDALLEIDPDNPEGFYYSAVAHYNLRDFQKAERSAELAVELDTGHQIPLAEQLLALLVARKGEFERAAALMRSFIAHAPPYYRLRGAERRLAQFESGVLPNVIPDPGR